MKISILCSSPDHPVNSSLVEWQVEMIKAGHNVDIFRRKCELKGGDLLFLISCSEIIAEIDRNKFKHSLVIHASDLPEGRGWSPHIWAIAEGRNNIIVSLLEADDSVDSGDIWMKKTFTLEGHELLSEINKKLFQIELELMTEAVENYADIKPYGQVSPCEKYYSKRTSESSCLDLDKSIKEQFNLLRVVDNTRYPAYFVFEGHKYTLKIEKANDE
jgi:methionyl-tRNA formyltransferase